MGLFNDNFSSAYSRRPSYQRSFNAGRLIIGLLIAAFSLLSYFGSKEFNPFTGEKQYLSITPEQEIALGLQAVPEMIDQFGGLSHDPKGQLLVEKVGSRLTDDSRVKDTDWKFNFHLLADDQTINAFSLPGGQVFITQALFSKLKTEDHLAGVLGHEIGHVLARHSAQHIAKEQLTQGLTGAVMAASGDRDAGRMAAFVGQMVNMKYGREDELQADELGVSLVAQANYDPRAMIEVMRILQEAGGAGPIEFFSTHPNPANRIEHIQAVIEEKFPQGVSAGWEP